MIRLLLQMEHGILNGPWCSKASDNSGSEPEM